MLEVPIGKDEYNQAYLQNETEKKKPPINALDCLNKRLAFCYNVEQDYVFRTVPSHLTGPAATQHDQGQDTVVARIL